VPRILAAALRAQGVADAAIEVIPDEQLAVDAALRMAQPGDLLLVFADALARTWKQITRFQPEGDTPRPAARIELPTLDTHEDEAAYVGMEGVKREERGLVFEREESD
jgi:cyanophycin synthetase